MMYRKGNFCFYNNSLFCQEGNCQACLQNPSSLVDLSPEVSYNKNIVDEGVRKEKPKEKRSPQMLYN